MRAPVDLKCGLFRAAEDVSGWGLGSIFLLLSFLETFSSYMGAV